jgi:hypothetical protein
MELRCHDCGSTQFRRSHLRVSDLRKLIFLQFPVRCAVCYARRFAAIPAVLSIKQKPLKRMAR